MNTSIKKKSKEEVSCKLVSKGSPGAERSDLVCSEPDEIIQIEELMTPFYREIARELPGPIPHYNYSSYHLFCLRKNLLPYLKKLNKNYSVNLSSKKNGYIMSIVAEIYEGDKYINLKGKELEYVKKAIQKVIQMYPMCLLYDFSDLKYDYKYRGKYHKQWATDLISDIFSNKSEKYKFKRGRIYTSLIDYPNHEEVWENKNLKIYNLIEEAFEKGAIYLSPKKQDFTKEWNMLLYYKGINLYYPNWNINIVEDKVSFLYDKMNSVWRFIYYDGRNGKQWRKVDVRNYEQLMILLS